MSKRQLPSFECPIPLKQKAYFLGEELDIPFANPDIFKTIRRNDGVVSRQAVNMKKNGVPPMSCAQLQALVNTVDLDDLWLVIWTRAVAMNDFTFDASDDDDVTVGDMLKLMAQAQAKPLRMVRKIVDQLALYYLWHQS